MRLDVREWFTEATPWRSVSTAQERDEAPDESWIRRRRDDVLSLVRERGGYTWEDEIACELGWSPTTVKRTLGELEAADLIHRYQIGPRAVICVSDLEHPRPRHVSRTIPGP